MRQRTVKMQITDDGQFRITDDHLGNLELPMTPEGKIAPCRLESAMTDFFDFIFKLERI